VEHGLLVGRGRISPVHLFSDRGDYKDFHLRVEAKINAGGNSGVYFRAEPALGPNGYPKGYEAQIFHVKGNVRGGTFVEGQLTGSLYNFKPFKETIVKPDEWFTLEVIAKANHILIKVNGQTTVDFVDEKQTYRQGHFALQQLSASTEIQFRKIEVKDLPPAVREK
jgi:hypothetical protein